MARLDEYNFIVTDLLTGNVLDTVELSSFHWEDIYKSPGSAQATARFDAETTTPANFKDWSNGLWAIKDGVIQWGGIIGKVQRRGSTRVIQVPVHGFFEWFRHRILRTDDGMTYGNLVRTSDIEWVAVDQFRIVEDLVNHIQDVVYTDADLNIGVTWSALSGELVTKVHKTTAVRYIGPIIEELSWRLDGFDWRYAYSFVADKPKVDINLEFPQLGTTNTNMLLFAPERNETRDVTGIRALDLDGLVGTDATAGDATNITGDLDVIFNAQLPDWTPGNNSSLRSKWGPIGNRSWRFVLLTTGQLRLDWSPNGTQVLRVDTVNPVPFANGTTGTVRVTLDVDNGQGGYTVNFWYSTDSGNTWIPIA